MCMVRVQHHLTAQQLKQLRLLSRRTGLAVADHVRRAVEAYLRQVQPAKAEGRV